jgi:hypothetical protein
MVVSGKKTGRGEFSISEITAKARRSKVMRR